MYTMINQHLKINTWYLLLDFPPFLNQKVEIRYICTKDIHVIWPYLMNATRAIYMSVLLQTKFVCIKLNKKTWHCFLFDYFRLLNTCTELMNFFWLIFNRWLILLMKGWKEYNLINWSINIKFFKWLNCTKLLYKSSRPHVIFKVKAK